MQEIKINEARKTIAQYELNKLSCEDIEDIIVSYWYMEEDDELFSGLGENAKKLIQKDWDGTALDIIEEFNVLIMDTLLGKYYGVKQEYIEKVLESITKINYNLIDYRNDWFPCPCCGYITLEDRGGHDICPVCYWEDDGSEKYPNKMSACNRLSFNEAKQNYKKYGVAKSRYKRAISPDEIYDHL